MKLGESDTGIGQRKFGKPNALKNDTSLNLETRSKHLSYRRFVIRSTVNKGCIQSKSKSVH